MANTTPPIMKSVITGGIVVIKIGPDGEEHHVHKALLVHHSEYFRNALTGKWKESKEQVITLEDVDPGILLIFVNWLYTQELPVTRGCWMAIFKSPSQCIDDFIGCFDNWHNRTADMCVNAYIFADRFLAPGFRRDANELFASTLLEPDFEMDKNSLQTFMLAFENIPSNRIMLQLMVDYFCQAWDDEDHDTYGEKAISDLPPAFLRRTLKSPLEMDIARGEVQLQKRCYEEHGSDSAKERCKNNKGKKHMRWDEETQLGYFE